MGGGLKPWGFRVSGNVTLEIAHHSCRCAHFPSAFALSTEVLVETARLQKSEKLPWSSEYALEGETAKWVTDMTTRCFVISSYKSKRRVSYQTWMHVERCQHVFFCCVCLDSVFLSQRIFSRLQLLPQWHLESWNVVHCHSSLNNVLFSEKLYSLCYNDKVVSVLKCEFYFLWSDNEDSWCTLKKILNYIH